MQLRLSLVKLKAGKNCDAVISISLPSHGHFALLLNTRSRYTGLFPRLKIRIVLHSVYLFLLLTAGDREMGEGGVHGEAGSRTDGEQGQTKTRQERDLN